MSKVTLRQRAREGDREMVERITRESDFFSAMEVDIALEVFDDFLADPQSGYNFVFADNGDETVGYANWGMDDQTVCSYELYWIVVDVAARHLGVGQALLQFAEKAIAKSSPAQLFVETAGRDQYTPTRRFYERQGYHRAAFLTDYYGPGDAKVIYSKSL